MTNSLSQISTTLQRLNVWKLQGLANTSSIKSKVWPEVRRWTLMLIGITIAALGYALFQIPHNIAAGGIGGIAIFINYFTGFPAGTMYLLLNIPLLVLGFFHLGRWLFVIRTTIAVLLFSSIVDLLTIYLPQWLTDYPITDDTLLNAVYAGLIGGIGGGLVYRAGSTMGGTGIVGRIIQRKTGTPLSQIYLTTDGLIVLSAGVIFGWELALYAMLTLFLSGLASDYALEGPSSVRVATIVTNHPQALAQALIDDLGRGVSQWEVNGGYTGQPHTMLTCTIYRPQVDELKRTVARIDPTAFVTIGVAHQALGEGFNRIAP